MVRRASKHPASTKRKHSVLVVDDEVDTLDSMRDLLEGRLGSVEVLQADSGPQALDVLRNHPVELIVSDYRMRPMDGVEFLSEAREIAPGVPRVMITAYPDVRIAMRAINEAGVDGFFLKPFEPEAVVDVVRKTIAGRNDNAERARRLARDVDAYRRAQIGKSG